LARKRFLDEWNGLMAIRIDASRLGCTFPIAAKHPSGGRIWDTTISLPPRKYSFVRGSRDSMARIC
jgi:hypothetical protein